MKKSTRSTKNLKKNLVIPKFTIPKPKETTQKLTRAIQPSLKIQNQMSELLRSSGLLQATKQLQDSLKSLALPQVMQQLQKSLESLVSTLELQHEFRELAKKIKKYKRVEKKVMLKSGWWLTPSLMSMPMKWISQAVNKYRNGDKTAIINLFRKVYQSNNCKYMEDTLTKWNKNNFFMPWKAHLDDALEAHKNKKYTLSVPAFLLIAEGIATKFCKKNKIYVNRSKGGEKIKEAVKQYYSQSDLDLLETAIDSTIYEDTNLIKEKLRTNVLNRHAVLHGLKKNYNTLKVSLQAFMLLDMLSETK